jgi:hypothetical protein
MESASRCTAAAATMHESSQCAVVAYSREAAGPAKVRLRRGGRAATVEEFSGGRLVKTELQ